MSVGVAEVAGVGFGVAVLEEVVDNGGGEGGPNEYCVFEKKRGGESAD